MPEINWVNERAKCSVAQMFEKLKLDIENDIKTRMEVRQTPYYYRFISVSSGNSFTVMREGNQLGDSVIFRLEGDHISVSKKDGSSFTATVSMNDEGECHFRVSGQEKTSWQLRRMALEEIFFIGL